MARRRKPAETSGDIPAARHPLLNLLLADVVVQNASRLLRQKASQRLLTDPEADPDTPMPLPQRLAALAALRVASRSWPGAAVVGAGLLAHNLYKRGKARRAEQAKLPHT